MAAVPPKYVGIVPGQLILQEGVGFTTTQWGFDVGQKTWLTHPSTPKAQWPQRGSGSTEYAGMFITDVQPAQDASGLILLTATFRGIKSINGSVMKERILPGADIAMFNLPATHSGKKQNILAPVPKPRCTREYLTINGPTLDGVGSEISGGFLPNLPDWSISFVPDDEEPLTVNYQQNKWILDDRSWEDVAGRVWLVREECCFYYSLAT